jgi:transposase
LSKGDIVIMDNLGSHKGKAARRAIPAAGAHLIFLPAYGTDLNPIEQVSTKLKHLTRDAQLGTVEATWRRTATSPISSPQPNAPTISQTQIMLLYKNSTLWCEKDWI